MEAVHPSLTPRKGKNESIHQPVWLSNASNFKIHLKHLEHFSSNSFLPAQKAAASKDYNGAQTMEARAEASGADSKHLKCQATAEFTQ